MAKLQEVWGGGVAFKVERKAETKSSKDLSHFKDNIKCLSGNYGTKIELHIQVYILKLL